MLKITSQNERLRVRMARKETIQLLHHIFCSFFNRRSNSHLKRYFRNWPQKDLFSSTFTKVRTICILTGRSRSVYRTFRLSRLKLREYATAGYFTGLAKASW